MNENFDQKVLEMFNTTMENVEEKTSVFQQSEGTNILKINMNSHDNQGTIVFIPLCDINNRPFFCSNVAEVSAFWKSKDGKVMDFARQLLSEDYYNLENNPEHKARYKELNDAFTAIYKDREMLTATDWGSSVRNQKYFGFYGWVISHNDVNGVPVKDSNGLPHTGKGNVGRLAFIQFRSTGFLNAWNNFIRTKSSSGASPAVWVPQIFNRNLVRSVALSISYGQDQNKKFSGSVADQWFANQINHLVNDPATNPQAYTLPENVFDEITDYGREFLNTTFDGNLFEERHVDDFEKAVKAVIRSFNFYMNNGKDDYDIYSAELGFNTPATSIRALRETTETGAEQITKKINEAKASNPLQSAATSLSGNTPNQPQGTPNPLPNMAGTPQFQAPQFNPAGQGTQPQAPASQPATPQAAAPQEFQVPKAPQAPQFNPAGTSGTQEQPSPQGDQQSSGTVPPKWGF